MKRVALFMILKIVEISILVFVPYWIGKLIQYFGFTVGASGSMFDLWSTGVMTLMLVALIIIALALIYSVCYANKKLVDYIMNRKGESK